MNPNLFIIQKNKFIIVIHDVLMPFYQASVAYISTMITGITGILAVMLISVRERVHEIGLRRALGAH